MKSIIVVFILVLSLVEIAIAQDVADPLSFQGMDRYYPMSARTRGMGGTVVAVGNNVGALFNNPAVLTSIPSFQAQISYRFSNATYEQTQRWYPNKRYPDLSLMFENIFTGIKDPDAINNPTDALHRPFDSITPEWSKNLSNVRPSTFVAGVPFSVDGMRGAVGIGFAEMINLSHFFQNNNAISPNLGNYRPSPDSALFTGETLKVQWFQFIRQRTGSVYGITPAFAVNLIQELQVGASLTILMGSSDDNQSRNDRGRLRLVYDGYLLDQIKYHIEESGTSKYKGTLLTIGGIFKQDNYSLGISLKPPATVTRDWDKLTQIDSVSSHQSITTSGSDQLTLPWFYTIGIALRPTEKWHIGVDYGIQEYADASFISDQGTTVSPWGSSKVFRAGVEFSVRKWLDLRAGAREESQAFTPAGEALIGEPASGAAYSLGFGLHLGKIYINGVGEFSTLKYNDLWISNVNTNKIVSYTGMLEFGYALE